MTDRQIWMNIEHAAVALGLSVRTVNRHINAGKLQSRLADGRREVLMDTTATPQPLAAQDVAGQASTSITGSNEVFVGEEQHGATEWPTAPDVIDHETILALADNAADKAELAVSAYQALALSADQRIQASRRLLNVAWLMVGMMTLLAFGSLGWTTNKITRANVEHENLQQRVTTVATQADVAEHECDDLRVALAQAREEAAHAEGKLAAYSEPRQTPAAELVASAKVSATTRPTTLVERLASILDK